MSSAPTLSDAYLQRFGGIARLYGQTALERLSTSHFLVVGIGGVGTWVAEALARTGVGTLTLIDMDEVCITNTNRQLHALADTIGHSKVEEIATRCERINPEIVVHRVEDFLDLENINELINDSVDVVIDAIDVPSVKATLIARCKRRKKLIISVGSAGGKVDPQRITTCDLSRTTTDPLLSKTRNFLRRLHGFSRNPKSYFQIQAVYSTEQMRYPDASGGVCASKAALTEGEASGVKLDCSGGFGASTMITGSFGFIAASKAIEKFLEKSERNT